MTALAERSQDLPANVEQHPATDTGSLLQIISRAASDQSVDIDKMERLMAMHERLVARDAEQAFNAALTAAQTEMHHMPRSIKPCVRSTPSTASR
jgi:hypothetical protein